MRRIAIIPAKRRSRRLPEKNLLSVDGVPMFAHSVKAAQKAEGIHRVVVSSEDHEILSIAERFGAHVHLRDPKLSLDTSTVADVCKAVLASEASAGRYYDIMVVLYATAPLRSTEIVKKVMELAEQDEVDGALAVTDYPYSPFQALKFTDGDTVTPVWPDLVGLKSENLPHVCVDNGSTYALKTSKFMEFGSFYLPRMKACKMPLSESIDLDEPSDLELLNYFIDKKSRSLR
ncbi:MULTISPECIES: acylneuraminate cytidylyltransferase family protein [Thalassospira]|uniref:CMP-N-acetylneuraminic acid synthetase n=2 Tax=Thalassospira TaxID=168934 RepID=A0A367WC86_9PROT|nr:MULTISPECIES: acylneuraminate cytidylyltransferase family protein [Thalassospira]MDG4717672.1 acylneuraminate cytidylyltransferase family protein [Thalassospira sp. FZY0004]RCK38869.1 hypothetical protein TH19_03460 [Thalassospira profundimaris]